MKYFYIWLISIVKFLLFGRRFLLFSPPILKKQIWYDKESKSFFSLIIRDNIDWRTNCAVFFDDQFSLSFHDTNLNKFSIARELREYYDLLLKEGYKPLILDCGSNNGASIKYFKLTYPESKIIGIEIDKENCILSHENLSADKNDIEIIHAGVSSRNGFGELIDPGLGNDAYRIEPNSLKGEVQLISINSLLENENQKDRVSPFLIKIDIEGGEQDLFSKNTEWVDRFPLIIIELHDWLLPKQNTSKNFLNVISKLNRRFTFRNENIFSVSNDLHK